MNYSGNRRKKYLKHGICLAILLLLMIAGLSRLKIQSVDSYEKESRQAAAQLAQETTEGSQDITGEQIGTDPGSEDISVGKEDTSDEMKTADAGKQGLDSRKSDVSAENDGKAEDSDAVPGTSEQSKAEKAKGDSANRSVSNKNNQKNPSSGKSGSSDHQKKKKPSGNNESGGNANKNGTAGGTGAGGENSASDSSNAGGNTGGGNGESQSASSDKTQVTDANGASGGDSGKDSSAATGKPLPTATQSPATEKPVVEKISCTIQIRCDSLVANKDKADASIQKYIPSDGTILAETRVSVEKGSSVYDVLEYVCKAKNIALDSEYTPLYKSYYVRGIGHLYEKQAGTMSGWLYKVNGKAPNKGASAYAVSDGDAIVWGYTCDGKTF